MSEFRTATHDPTPGWQGWFALTLAGLGVLLAVKLMLAWHLPLFGDEAFYWLESQHPAPAYSDLPFMTAMLVRAGTMVAGDTYLGVRLFFLVLGTMVPWLVWLLARRFGGKRAAWPAAAASFCVPLAATLGVLALPDVPLIVFGLGGLVAFVRALDGGSKGWWLAAGGFAALGFCTHYRFAALLAGPVLYLLISPHGRRWLTTPWPWLAALVTLAGLLPIIQFNLAHDFAGLSFQFVERHSWQFQWEGWRYLPVQALVVTPLMFVVLMAAFAPAARRWRTDAAAGAVVFFSATILAGFTLAAFFTDGVHMSAHWTLAGYLPLLIWLSAVLTMLPRWLRPWIPLSGLAGTLVLLGYLVAAIRPGAFPGLEEAKAFPDNFSGWRQAASGVSERLDAMASPVLVADNYMIAAELDFELASIPRVYALDHAHNRRHGRALQMALWGLDEAGLRKERAGREALIVVEESALKIGQRPAWVRRLCTRFEPLSFRGESVLSQGRKRFLYFSGRIRPEPAPPPATAIPTVECDLPPHAYLIEPSPASNIRDVTRVHGWAVEDNAGVAEVVLLVDGERAAGTTEFFSYPDVQRFLPGSVDPTHPNAGFEMTWDPAGLSPGMHDIALKVITHDGNERILEKRRVQIIE